MHPHPLIHAELARQSEQERRKAQGGLRKGSHLAATPDDGLALTVLAARSGSEQAWQNLIARFTPMLRGIVRSYRLNDADTDDVVQTVWASAFSHLDRLREAQAFGGWLCVIARREALSTIRKRQCEIPVDEMPAVHASDDSSPEANALDAEQREALHIALGRLPDRQRTLLVAFLSRPETSYSDVSQALGLPVGAIGPTRGARDRAAPPRQRAHGPRGAPVSGLGLTGRIPAQVPSGHRVVCEWELENHDSEEVAVSFYLRVAPARLARLICPGARVQSGHRHGSGLCLIPAGRTATVSALLAPVSLGEHPVGIAFVTRHETLRQTTVVSAIDRASRQRVRVAPYRSARRLRRLIPAGVAMELFVPGGHSVHEGRTAPGCARNIPTAGGRG